MPQGQGGQEGGAKVVMMTMMIPKWPDYVALV